MLEDGMKSRWRYWRFDFNVIEVSVNYYHISIWVISAPISWILLEYLTESVSYFTVHFSLTARGSSNTATMHWNATSMHIRNLLHFHNLFKNIFGHEKKMNTKLRNVRIYYFSYCSFEAKTFQENTYGIIVFNLFFF